MFQKLMSTKEMFIFISFVLQGVNTTSSEESKLLCPKDWEYYKDANLCLYMDLSDKLDGVDIYSACQNVLSNVWTLVPVITSQKSINAISSFLRKKYVTFEPVWVGANDIEEEGLFLWYADGQQTKYHDPGFKLPFKKNQPNDNDRSDRGLNAQDCLAVNSEGKFNDRACKNKYPYLCAIYDTDQCKIDNGGCEDICTVTGPRRTQCGCRAGFKLKDIFYCEDIDECLDGRKGSCQHICINFHGGRECFCKPGYTKVNETSCALIDP